MLTARAVALQGIGYEPRLIAVQGFSEIAETAFAGGGGYILPYQFRRQEPERKTRRTRKRRDNELMTLL